jgi:hypothetical protein
MPEPAWRDKLGRTVCVLPPGEATSSARLSTWRPGLRLPMERRSGSSNRPVLLDEIDGYSRTRRADGCADRAP